MILCVCSFYVQTHRTCPASILWIAGVVEHVENGLFLTCCFAKKNMFSSPSSFHPLPPIQSSKHCKHSNKAPGNRISNNTYVLPNHGTPIADNSPWKPANVLWNIEHLALESYSFRSPQHTFHWFPVSLVFLTILTCFLTLESPKQENKTNSNTTPVWQLLDLEWWAPQLPLVATSTVQHCSKRSSTNPWDWYI